MKKFFKRLLKIIFCILSGEFILTRWKFANSGGVVLSRALISTLWLYSLAIGIKSRLSPGATWCPDWGELLSIVGTTIPWFGAIFAGTYAAYYTRFSSQWSYLASLYNSIMEAQIAQKIEDKDLVDKARPMAKWMAGFIEDAYTLHLHRKEMFSGTIKSMLRHEGVREAVKEFSSAGMFEQVKADLGYVEPQSPSFGHGGGMGPVTPPL